MHRFFVQPDCINGDVVSLPESVGRQVSRVLRLRPGDAITLLDDSGMEYEAVMLESNLPELDCRITSKTLNAAEPRLRVTLFQGVLKSDKFEWVLQKGTELGAAEFVPVVCERSVSRQRDAGRIASRLQRWQKIVTEAAEQSGRGRIPKVKEPLQFEVACQSAPQPSFIPWEMATRPSLGECLRAPSSDIRGSSELGVFIGPEGGFSEREIGIASNRGIVPVSLGKRILRAETAGLAVLSAVMYELGEMEFRAP